MVLPSKENPEGQMTDTIQEAERVTIIAIHILKNSILSCFLTPERTMFHPNFLVLILVSHGVNIF